MAHHPLVSLPGGDELAIGEVAPDDNRVTRAAVVDVVHAQVVLIGEEVGQPRVRPAAARRSARARRIFPKGFVRRGMPYEQRATSAPADNSAAHQGSSVPGRARLLLLRLGIRQLAR